MGLQNGFEVLGLLLGVAFVVDAVVDAESTAGLFGREQRFEVLVDLPGDPGADAPDLVGVLGEGLQLKDAAGGVAEVHVLAGAAPPVAGDGTPVAGVGA